MTIDVAGAPATFVDPGGGGVANGGVAGGTGLNPSERGVVAASLVGSAFGDHEKDTLWSSDRREMPFLIGGLISKGIAISSGKRHRKSEKDEAASKTVAGRNDEGKTGGEIDADAAVAV